MDVKKLLTSLDDPVFGEWPGGWSVQLEQRVSARFQALAERVRALFDTALNIDCFPPVQDASFFGDVRVPSDTTDSGLSIGVRVSNFGSLAILYVESPGAFTEAEFRQMVHPRDVDRLASATSDAGLTVIPEDELWQPYDGVNLMNVARLNPENCTWFTRYFDYI